MKIYLAGKITDNPNYREEFARAERRLTALGHAVINPVKNDGFSYKDYIDMGLAQLSKCDAIYMLDNNSDFSKGARLERQYAHTVGIEVIWESFDCELEKKKGE